MRIFATAVISTQSNSGQIPVRLERRDARERRETFVSFVASRPGVSRHAVTVTARNARRFVRHGVSITRVGPRSDDRVSLYQSLQPVAILLPPFDYYPSFSPRARRAVHFYPTHVSTVHLHPLLGFAYVRPVCQLVLLTDVRIDNLCPLIMTVRSRARRYLTVRVIAISSSMPYHPHKSRPKFEDHFNSGRSFKFGVKSRTESRR